MEIIMKHKIKIAIILAIFIVIIIGARAYAQSSGFGFSSANLWKKSGDGIFPFATSTQLGASTTPIYRAWFSGVFVNGTTTLGYSTTTSYLEVEHDGTPILHGGATGWEDLRFPANTLAVGVVPADVCTFSSSNIRTRCFDGNNTLESMDLQIQMPHAKKLDSTIYPHFHFAPTSNATGTVKLFLEYTQADSNDVFSATTTVLSATTTISTASQWKSLYTNEISIDTTGWNTSSMMMARIYRNPVDSDDTYPDDIALQEFDIHYEIDSIGSRQERSK